MKKIKILLLLALSLLTLIAAPASARESIEDFSCVVRIQDDSSIEVTEKILINVEHTDIKRGIVRSFPIEYKDAEGRDFEVGFDIISVTVDGEDIPWEISYDGSYANVRIGDPDSLIAKGARLFTIEYISTRQVGFFEDYDELYWNATGHAWSWPILSASCTVYLPKREPPAAFRSIEWYVSRYGEKGSKGNARLSGSTVTTTKPLLPGEGLTVVYTWPKGILTPPPPPFGNEKAQAEVAAVTALLMWLWFFFALYKWGGAAPAPAVIPRFYPPKDSSPAFVRYIMKMSVDQISFTSDIIGLAVKGALKIEENESGGGLLRKKRKKFTLVKLSDDVEMTRDETAIMERLFPGGAESVTIDKAHAKRLAAASAGLKRGVVALGRKLFSSDNRLCVTSMLIFAAGLSATLPFTGEDIFAIILSAFLGGVVIVIAMVRNVKISDGFTQKLATIIVSLIPPAVLSVMSWSILYDEGQSGIIALLFVAAAASVSLLRPLLFHRTPQGAEIFAEVKGLELYITVAEKDRMEMLNAPEETPQLFERLLPYAVALGAAKTWGERFAEVLKKAEYTPQWYDGPSPYIFMDPGSFGNFSDALGSSMASGMKPERAPSLSSGAGGGGFSGGGGGGGGGSGW